MTRFAFVSAPAKDHIRDKTEVILSIRGACLASNFSPYVFIDEAVFTSDSEMMEISIRKIRESSVLVAEATTKAVGVGIEVGVAASIGLPIIYLRRRHSTYSSTIGGLSDFAIEYDSAADLYQRLIVALERIR